MIILKSLQEQNKIFLKKLHNVFKTNSLSQLIVVFIVFGISGSVSVLISTPILNYLNYDEYIKSSFIKFILNILIIFPIYQIILLFVGTLFGQFNYFWTFQKKFFYKFVKKKVE